MTAQLRTHRLVAAAALLLALVAGVTVFLDWHRVEASRLGDALSCAFIPDCDPKVVSGYGPGKNDSGLDHTGPLGVALVGLVLLVWGFAIGHTGWKLDMVAAAVSFAVCVASLLWALASTFLSHMFDRVTVLWPIYLFFVSMVGCAALSVVGVVLQIRRRRAQRRSPVPRAPTAS